MKSTENESQYLKLCETIKGAWSEFSKGGYSVKDDALNVGRVLEETRWNCLDASKEHGELQELWRVFEEIFWDVLHGRVIVRVEDLEFSETTQGIGINRLDATVVCINGLEESRFLEVVAEDISTKFRDAGKTIQKNDFNSGRHHFESRNKSLVCNVEVIGAVSNSVITR